MRGLPEPVEVEADLLVIGGGTAGCVAAARAKEGDPGLRVVIAEKAGIRSRAVWPWGLTPFTPTFTREIPPRTM